VLEALEVEQPHQVGEQLVHPAARHLSR